MPSHGYLHRWLQAFGKPAIRICHEEIHRLAGDDGVAFPETMERESVTLLMPARVG